MKLIAITGMHRSNTSALAKIFHDAGYEMGNELMEASWANPKGYFEDKDIIALEERLIAKITKNKFKFWYIDKDVELDYSCLDKQDYEDGRQLIQNKCRDGQLFIWKSPRTTLLLEYWKTIFPELRFIFLVRHFHLVSDSLVNRGDMWKFSKIKFLQKRKALRIWYKYNLEIKRFLNENQALLLVAPQLFADKNDESRLNHYLKEYLESGFHPINLLQNYEKNLLKTKLPHTTIADRLFNKKYLTLYNDLESLNT